METADLMLDGNALGGALGEVFVGEITVARSTCASCGAVREIGALAVYAQAPGSVARCPAATRCSCGSCAARAASGSTCRA